MSVDIAWFPDYGHIVATIFFIKLTLGNIYFWTKAGIAIKVKCCRKPGIICSYELVVARFSLSELSTAQPQLVFVIVIT